MRHKIRILVTGSRGFIGTHLIASLRSARCEFIQWEGDIRGIGKSDQEADVVIHLAAASRHDQFKADLQASYEANIMGTLSVLNYCKKAGARCVLVSTSGVYQAPEARVAVDEDAAMGPTSPYSISKWLAERICCQQSRDFGVPSVVLRLFNVYGQGQHPSFLVPYIMNCLNERKSIVLRMPNAVRDFIHVEDVVEALIKASQLTIPGFRVFNIGTGKGTRVLDLVNQAEAVFGASVEIEIDQPHGWELDIMFANINRAKQELGWQPKFTLMSGLSAMKDSASLLGHA